jgi:pimeloyl-ACP methyl ester carboxylesterase
MTWVLLPGLDGTGRLFAPFLDVIDEPVQVVSYPTDEVLDYDALTERVARDLPEDCVLIAESFSGPIGIRLAHRARALVLVATFATAPVPLRRVWRVIGGVAARIPVPKQIFRRLLLDGDATSELVDTLFDAMRSVDSEVVRQRVADVLCVDVRAELDAMDTPILYLQAERDRVVPASAVDEITARVVGVDSPHLLLQSRPELAASAIRAFLSRP